MNVQLRALTDSGRIPHALVLDGGTPESRIAAARELASALVCSSDSNGFSVGTAQKPCHNCTACQKAEHDIHPDITYIVPDKNKKTIGVDIIRRMREDAYILPNEGENKVYIIPQADLMQDYAQNALLKILEEPPSFATFILLCDTHSFLLPTVISRVAVFNLDDNNDISGDGDYDTALEQARLIAKCISEQSEFDLIITLSYFEKNYDLLPMTLDCLQFILRDALVIRSGGNTIISLSEDDARALSRSLSENELLEVLDSITDIVKSINIYGNKNLILSRLSSKLIGGNND